MMTAIEIEEGVRHSVVYLYNQVTRCNRCVLEGVENGHEFHTVKPAVMVGDLRRAQGNNEINVGAIEGHGDSLLLTRAHFLRMGENMKVNGVG